MKKILFILLCFTCSTIHAQKLPDIGLYKIHLTQPDRTIVAEIDPVNNNPKPKPNLFYYWFSANIIHTTQGGFSGNLLNGQYNEYYLNKNLKEQGAFKKGLKDGIWKSWNEDGSLNQTTNWRSGLVYVKKPSIFWKKINIFKKKQKNKAADSTANP